MLEFHKYPSIENSYQKKFVSLVLNELSDYNDYIVQEKIHGANFSFHYDGVNLSCAKRTDFIHEGEKFYDYETVRDFNSEKIKKLYSIISTDKSIAVYGELYGDGVQKEIKYSKNKRFYAFDICVDGLYLSVDKCNELFERTGISYAKTLLRGTLDECFAFEIERNSIHAEDIGDYSFEQNENIMEGVVIRPNETLYAKNSRVIFKKKTTAFSEKKAPDKIQSDPRKYSEYEQYITPARVIGLVSKGLIPSEESERTKRNLPIYAQHLIDDIFIDYNKEHDEPADIEVRKFLVPKCIKAILTEVSFDTTK